ncbi:MAG TPA: hypothetical protein VK178_14125 [Opitutaceae bacterium]|nr:hypothetical protein [Opitutaceae bacterium]
MPSTIATLLHRSLDYAGVFPPASLPVPAALQQFEEERSANSAGMLSRFVCPVLRLEEMAAVPDAGERPSLVVSILPRGGRSAGEFLANLEADLAAIQRIAQLHRGALVIDTIELRPPGDALQQPALRKLLAAVSALLSRRAADVRQVFVELTPGAQLASQLELLADPSIGGASEVSLLLGYKLRTGGSDATAAPSPAQVATALGCAAALQLPMKCTGGLHRPLRGTGANPMHGFINLLVAATFAATLRNDAGLIESVLEETDPAAFAFDARAIAWREHKLTPKAVTAAREKLLLSFGSCYADQPRLELQKLGWWPKPVRTEVVGIAH